MKLATFDDQGRDAVGLIRNEALVPVADLLPDAPTTMIGLIEAGPTLLRALADMSSTDGNALPLAGVTLLPPIPRPGKILCIGLNYVDHAAEGGTTVPDYPAVFMRTASSLVAPGAPVLRPRRSDRLDYEAELTVVIGRRCHDVGEDEALDHVFGYTLFNDVSVRDYQRKTTQWTMGKNFDGTGPMGPAIVTKDDLPAGASGLGIRTRLNGQTVQDASTDQMVFKVPRLVSLISQVMTLEPGDVIATGTPSGVAHARKPPLWMKPGDRIEVEVDGIGTLGNPVADAAGSRLTDAA
ncbi:MAG: fumarylacetoacetate hydrolase family protein [Pseudomonadota bacterium]